MPPGSPSHLPVVSSEVVGTARRQLTIKGRLQLLLGHACRCYSSLRVGLVGSMLLDCVCLLLCPSMQKCSQHLISSKLKPIRARRYGLRVPTIPSASARFEGLAEPVPPTPATGHHGAGSIVGCAGRGCGCSWISQLCDAVVQSARLKMQRTGRLIPGAGSAGDSDGCTATADPAFARHCHVR